MPSVSAILSPREHIPIARLLADSLVFVRTFVITEDTYVALKDQPLVIGQNLCSYFGVDDVVVVKPDGSEAVVERDGVKVEAVV